MGSKEFTAKTFNWLYQINRDFELLPIDMKVAVQLTVHFNEKDDDGRAYPGLRTIGDAIGVSEPTMVRSIRRLERRGHLRVVWGSAGRGRSNQYWMIVKPPRVEVSDDKKPPRVEVSDPHKTSIRESENLHSCSVKPPRMDQNHLVTTERNHTVRAAPQEGAGDAASIATATAGKSDPSDEEPDTAFETFWAVYPKQVGKREAKREFNKAVREGVAADDIIAGARGYATDPVRIKQSLESDRYTKNPNNWLREGRWADKLTGGKPTLDEHGNLVATPRSYSNSGGSWAEDIELLRAHFRAGTFGKWGMQ